METSPEALKKQTPLVVMPKGNDETVLVVDDEASILTITGQTLQTFGYRVLLAQDGAKALSVYAEHKNEIAVVLTDMAMPLMDGAAMIHALRRINPKVKIIATSGFQENPDPLKDAALSAKYFLTKPYPTELLLKTLREALGET